MPYQPTGRPAGRPRTSDLTAISVKLPQDLLLDAVVEAELAQTTVSALLRDGLAWRLKQTALDQATRRCECGEIRRILRREAAEEAQARLAAERVARAEQEWEAFHKAAAMILAETQGVTTTPTRGQVGSLGAIVKQLAPAHPDGVTATAVLAYCDANKVTWATPELVGQALETLRREHGYPIRQEEA